MGKKSSTSSGNFAIGVAVRDHLFEIEPDLQHLRAIVALLTILGEADDSIEPVALAGLAHLGGEALERVTRSWRAALAAVCDQPGTPE